MGFPDEQQSMFSVRLSHVSHYVENESERSRVNGRIYHRGQLYYWREWPQQRDGFNCS